MKIRSSRIRCPEDLARLPEDQARRVVATKKTAKKSPLSAAAAPGFFHIQIPKTFKVDMARNSSTRRKPFRSLFSGGSTVATADSVSCS